MNVRRAILSLFALAVLVPSTAMARTRFLCEVDQLVRDSCCCPPKKARPPIDTPTMKPECCKLERHSVAAAPVAVAATTQPIAAPAVIRVAVTIAVPPPSAVRAAITPRAQAPPLERSLLSLHCALLV